MHRHFQSWWVDPDPCLFFSSFATSLIQPPQSLDWPSQKEVMFSRERSSHLRWPHLQRLWWPACSPDGHPFPEQCLPTVFPVLPITVSWSSFLVPTHSGSELRSFRNAAAIAALQDEAQLTLNSYIHTRWLLFALNMYLRKLLPLWMCRQAGISQSKHCD